MMMMITWTCLLMLKKQINLKAPFKGEKVPKEVMEAIIAESLRVTTDTNLSSWMELIQLSMKSCKCTIDDTST